eukprot:8696866-Heterocapsa_arctica.AAC.1
MGSVLITEIDPVCTQSANMNDGFVEGGAVHDSQVDEQSYFLIVCYRATDVSVCDAAELTAYNALCEIT